MANETETTTYPSAAAQDSSKKTDGPAPASELPLVMRLVNANDVSSVERLLVMGEASVYDTDTSGMTPLMHAAYKGLHNMCQMLLKQGSDVNADCHSHSYSALHFAALSSSLDTTQLLLDAGARTYKTNSLSRTAAQMAGFVGHASCVAVINNHVNRSELRRYTQPSSLHQTTRLDPAAEDSLYQFIMQVNLHPVHLSLVVGRCPVLLQHLRPAAAVLDHLSVAETRKTTNVNEILCLKFHYLGYLLKFLAADKDRYDQSNQEEKPSEAGDGAVPVFEFCLKQFLRCRPSDGAEVWQDVWIRKAIKAFHCFEMPLFVQVVRSLCGEEVQALSVLSGAINGQRGFAAEDACCACGSCSSDNKKCSKCKVTQYCDRYCQKLHWFSHKKFCDNLAKTYAKQEKLNTENKTSSDQANTESKDVKEDTDLINDAAKLDIKRN